MRPARRKPLVGSRAIREDSCWKRLGVPVYFIHMMIATAFNRGFDGGTPSAGVSNNQVEKQSYQHVNSWISWKRLVIAYCENGLQPYLIIHFNAEA